jgi:hypothetical protein
MLTLKSLLDGWHKLLTVGAAALIIPGLINTHAWAVGGGDPIEPDDRALAERMVRIEAGGKTCSGVVYAGNAVLTAAHCLHSAAKPRVRASDVRLYLHSDEYRSPISPSRVVLHPDYEGSLEEGLPLDRDLAIVFLRAGPELPPLELGARRTMGTYDAHVASKRVFGYGPCEMEMPALGKIEFQGVLQFPGLYNIAGDPERRQQICEGDSGGGVFLGTAGMVYGAEGEVPIVYPEDPSGVRPLLGIVTGAYSMFASPEKCPTCSAGLQYIRADVFRDWIIETVANDQLVRDIQEALNAAGCKAGPVDGIWGSRSHAALTRFAEATGAGDHVSPNGAVLERIRASVNHACGPGQ